jgi:hypothetical protein
MFDMISRTAMMVSDLKAYPDQFPKRDPRCLVSASFTHKDVQAMHTEDAIDDADLPKPLPPVSIFDQPFSSMTESKLATAFLKLPSSNNNVAFVLPSQYRPPTFGPPEADMIVLGTRVQRLSELKSALWVRFLSPPSYKDKKLASQLRG